MAEKSRIIAPALLVVAGLLLAAVFVSAPSPTNAGKLTFVSDLITNSVPGEAGSHTITFTTANTIPASGKISVAFEAGGITNLASLNVEDIDVASSSDYTLAAAPSGGTLGVTFSGSGFEIVLGDTPVTPGTALTIELGPIAGFGAAGDTSLINGPVTGSYTVAITTKTSADTIIDYSEAVFVILNPVGLSASSPTPGGGGGGPSTPTPTATPLAGLALWPNAGSNPDVFGARLLETSPSANSETSLTAVVANGSGLVQLGIGGTPISFATTTGEPSVAAIAAGNWIFNTYAWATDVGGNTALFAHVSVRHPDGTETFLFQHQITPNLASSPVHYISTTYQPEFTVGATEQLILRYFAQTTGSVGITTVTLYYQGTDQYSHVITPPFFTPLPSCFRIADFNGDCRVNIVDLSILLYNWGFNPPNPVTDLNTDGSVGIIDLSILLYWWTG